MPNESITAREWCFTINNPSDADRGFLLQNSSEFVTYLCFQPERGEASGTSHLQGYLCLKQRRTMLGCKRTVFRLESLRGVHLEVTRGTKDQARDYCRKEESRDTEAGFSFTEIGSFGDVPEERGQGARNDISAATRIIEAGGTMREVASTCPEAFVKFHKGFIALESTLHAKPRVREPGSLFSGPRVLWFHGRTGSGKSHAAFEEAERASSSYVKMPGSKWFDGYIGQECVIFDDYRGDWFSFGFLLRLLDKYPVRVEVKGGSVEWSPSLIIITCPKTPQQVYAGLVEKDDGSIEQLLRRIHEVKLFGEPEPAPTPFYPTFTT